jgi:hypothetical protein
VIAGPNFVVDLYSNEDPPDPGSATYNVESTKTTSYTAYIDGATFNVLPGVAFRLQAPVIYGSTSLNLGQSGDSSGSELIVISGSSGSVSSVTFNDALSTLVIGIDQLATTDVPASGNGPFTAEANPNQGQLLISEFDRTIKGFQSDNMIDVDTYLSLASAGTLSANGSIVSVIEIANGDALGVLRFDSAANASAAIADQETQLVPCFAASTRIATARGEVAVEAIGVGEKVRMLLGGGLGSDALGGRADR